MDGIKIIENDIGSVEELELNLLHSLKNLQTQSENKSLTLSVKDTEGTLVAGVSGSSSYGWLLVKLLWVSDSYQRQGLGTKLMQLIEEKAKTFGCHGAWLDTSNAKAMEFYKTLGYESFGQLSNTATQFPPEHHRWFMKKLF